MTQNSNILQELNDLKSILAKLAPQNVYTAPEGYFDGLAGQVLNRVKAMEAVNAAEELAYLSPALNKISREMPYTLPKGYFEGLEETLMQSVRESNDYQTAKEELETLSPLLSGLKKQMPFSVPQGYFETLPTVPSLSFGEARLGSQGLHEASTKTNKPETKVVLLTSRKLFRYAAAAMITGVIALAGFMYFNFRNHVDPLEQPYAWVKKSIKKVDKEDIDAFVKLADEELTNQAVAASNPVKPEEIKELMKDVSDKEIQDFLDETPDTENSDETIMN